MVRPKMVQSINGYLLRDKGLKAPLSVNKVNGKYRIVDGNHRLEGLKRYLGVAPSRYATVNLAIYENLTVEEEKELFNILAKTVVQSVHDYLKIHFDDIPLLGRLKRDFPIKVKAYPGKDSITYARLLLAWLYKDYTLVHSMNKETLVSEAKKLGSPEHADMSTFFRGYSSVFGLPDKISPYYKPGPLWIVMSLFYRNCNLVDTVALWKVIRDKCYNNTFILNVSKIQRYVDWSDARELLLGRLNGSWRGTRLI